MISHIKAFYKENKLLSILLSVTFLLILTTGIYFKQNWLKMLPLFVSLIIMVLQARVNRYALLLGSFNSLLYCYYYFTVGLYSQLVYAIVFSFPLQLVSFFTWHKKTKNNVTELKRMNVLQAVASLFILILSWLALYFAMSFFNPSYSLLDTTVSIIGVAATLLTMLRFSEYTILQLISQIITMCMHIVICLDGQPENITYLVFSMYSFVCVILAIIRMHRADSHILENTKK